MVNEIDALLLTSIFGLVASIITLYHFITRTTITHEVIGLTLGYVLVSIVCLVVCLAVKKRWIK